MDLESAERDLSNLLSPACEVGIKTEADAREDENEHQASSGSPGSKPHESNCFVELLSPSIIPSAKIKTGTGKPGLRFSGSPQPPPPWPLPAMLDASIPFGTTNNSPTPPISPDCLDGTNAWEDGNHLLVPEWLSYWLLYGFQTKKCSY